MTITNNPVVSGRYYTLKVEKKVGRYLMLDANGESISLPVEEAHEACQSGDQISVFVYKAGKDGLKATTRKPHACLGEFASMKVRSVTDFGIFLDWGIVKDLFVPSKNLRVDLQAGDMAVVQVIPDYDGIGAIGTCRFEDVFDTDTSGLKENQEVTCLVFGFSEAGIRVILDGKYKGLLYRNEIFEDLQVGDRRKGFIKKIREDGLIDAALQKQKFREASEDARETILDALRNSGGFLPLHDKSNPDEIADVLKMSKKIFKKTIGGLYREKLIALETQGIRLIQP